MSTMRWQGGCVCNGGQAREGNIITSLLTDGINSRVWASYDGAVSELLDQTETEIEFSSVIT